MHVRNGTRAVITNINTQQDSITVRLADGSQRHLPARYLHAGQVTNGSARRRIRDPVRCSVRDTPLLQHRVLPPPRTRSGAVPVQLGFAGRPPIESPSATTVVDETVVGSTRVGVCRKFGRNPGIGADDPIGGDVRNGGLKVLGVRLGHRAKNAVDASEAVGVRVQNRLPEANCLRVGTDCESDAVVGPVGPFDRAAVAAAIP